MERYGLELAGVFKGGGETMQRALETTETERKGISHGNFGSCMFSEIDPI